MIKLQFDQESSYVGSFTDRGIEYDCWRSFYCSKPICDQEWDVYSRKAPSEEFFKLNPESVKFPHFQSQP